MLELALIALEVLHESDSVEEQEQLPQDHHLGILHRDDLNRDVLNHSGLEHHTKNGRPGRQDGTVSLDLLSLTQDDKVTIAARLQQIPKILLQLGPCC